MNIAETIYSQLGGNRFKAMTGAHSLVSDGNTFQFSFKGSKKSK